MNPATIAPHALAIGPLRFADGRWVWGALVLVVIVAAAFIIDAIRRKRALAALGHVPQLARMAGTVSTRRRAVKATLVTLAVASLTLAYARPQIEGQSSWRQHGVDLVVVMDFSKSMHALDVRPSRLARARLEAGRMLDMLRGDRVGVVAFAGAQVHYPLTTDYDAVRLLLDGLEPEDLAPGSNLAEALMMARCLLRPDVDKDADCARTGRRGHGGDPLSENDARTMREKQIETTDLGDRARAIVLITDGEATEGDAMVQAQKAADLGIEVFVIGIGTPQGAPIPDLDSNGQQHGWKTDDNGQTVISKLDEEGLEKLAAVGGATDRYYRVAPGKIGAAPITSALGRLKEGELESRVVKSYNEAYQWFLYPGFLCLLIEAVMLERRRRRAS